MKVVLVMFKGDQRREFNIADGKSTIGRNTECTLRIVTGDVSRKHCELELSGDSLKLRDLGSSNGTFLNGKRIAETAVQAGDRLSIGPVHFVIQIDGKPAQIRPDDATPKSAVAVASKDEPDLDLDADADTAEILDLDDLDFDFDDDDDDDEPKPKGKPGKK